MKRTFSALLVIVAIVPGCAKQQGGHDNAPPPVAAQAETPATGKPAAAPDAVTVEIKDFDGIQELLASKRGKVVVMDCWSTFCEPCMKEFPGLVELQKEYGPDDLACISLSFNYDGAKNETPEEHQEQVLNFLRQQHATFDNVIASVPADTLYQKLGFKSASVPAIFVYDRDGNAARQFEGPDAKYSDVRTLVVELLDGAK